MKVALPLLTLIPPVAVAFGTDNVGLLVNITGSYGTKFGLVLYISKYKGKKRKKERK